MGQARGLRTHTGEENPFHLAESDFPPLWRRHSDTINGALLNRWLPENRIELLLKTDLFDEAVSEGLHAVLAARAKRLIGIDLSLPVIREARLRYPDFQAVATDARSLSFPDHTFDVVVSISTLDHFRSTEEIVISLRELYRVLRPGGMLILTLDNLANPSIALRNALPFPWLNRLRILPCHVDATCGPRRLRTLLERVGFRVPEVDAVMHCPRVLAVAVARGMQKSAGPASQTRFLRFLRIFEGLSRLPTRFLTGYFIAVRTHKPVPEAVSERGAL